MELDTGSALSIIPESKFREHFDGKPLSPSDITLRTNTGEQLPVIDTISVSVETGGTTKQLQVHVVRTCGPPLFGRDWLRELQLNWSVIHAVRRDDKPEENTPASGNQPYVDASLRQLKTKYADVFSTGQGCLHGTTGRLQLKPDAEPKFAKARPLPYAMQQHVETQLDQMEATRIITPVSWGDWVTPIVPVSKPNGAVRICGDFKVTLSPQLHVKQYPLPRADDVFASLAGGKKFSKLDLRSAYNQMEMDNKAANLLTLNTHKGLYRLNRLVLGVASAPALWQCAMDTLLSGLSKVHSIIVTGKDDDEHLANLEEVR